MSHFISVPSLVLFPKNNKPWNKRKEDFLYIWLLQHITLNNHIFRNTCMYINNPYWQSSGIIIILCKYDTVTSDTLTDSWMYFSDCSLWYYQSFMGIPEEKIGLQRKVMENLCEGHQFFWLHALLLISFLLIFSSNPSFSSTPILRWRKNFALENGGAP